jgi:spore coat polysaccharide biosynthesis protein SpsF
MMASEVVVVLQARMGSVRLPGKALAPIDGLPILSICLQRLLAGRVGRVVLATTASAEDDCLAREASKLDVEAIRGSSHDVLSRFLQAVRVTGAPFVVRATADNPAVDIDAARRGLDTLERWRVDYCCERGLPVGAVVEVFRASALIDAGCRATSGPDREHVTTYIRREVGRYRVAAPDAPEGLRRPDLRLTVDTAEDLEFVRTLAGTLPEPLTSAPLAAVIAKADLATAERRSA